jgi:hypothetical protein
MRLYIPAPSKLTLSQVKTEFKGVKDGAMHFNGILHAFLRTRYTNSVAPIRSILEDEVNYATLSAEGIAVGLCVSDVDSTARSCTPINGKNSHFNRSIHLSYSNLW